MKLAFVDMFPGLTTELSLSGFGKRQIRLQHVKLPLRNTYMYLLGFTKKLLRESTFLDNKSRLLVFDAIFEKLLCK